MPDPQAPAGAALPEELLAAIAESTTVAIFVKDREGLYRFVNRFLAELWRRPPSEIVGKSDLDLFPEPLARSLRENDRRVMDERRPLTEEEEVDFQEGTRIYLTSKVPLVDENDVVYGVCGIATDITHRKRMEHALRESEERFRALADSAPVLIWMSGPDKEGVFFNQTWLEFTGHSLEDEMGDRWLEGVHPQDRSALEECTRAFGERRPFQTRFRLRRADGEYRWLLDTGVPRTHPDGSFAGYIGSCVDITQQVRLESVLRAQAKALTETHERKDEFLAMLSHELRNPMAPLRNVIELFRSRQDDLDEELRRGLDIADRQLSHVNRLVDDLLDVARITRGRIQLERAPMRIRGAAESAIETIRPFLERRNLRLEVDLPAESPVVDGDETRLAQVFGNLLHNAAKYTPEGGRIEVSVEAGDDWAQLSVRDSGIGIAPDRLDDVFELFQQTEQTLDRSQGGLGLGLALARRLVEMHGGEVSAESEGLGKGSTFRVRLPRLHEPSVENRATDTMRPSRAREGQRILIVDDNVDSADSLSVLLDLDGHEVATAYDGEQALERIVQFSPDVILLDIGLPRIDGYEVARRIRLAQGAQPVLVALTGYGQDSAIAETVRAGFDHHLLKPVDPATLREILARSPGRGA
jgi:two-component system CheB/CheR fusion protein